MAVKPFKERETMLMKKPLLHPYNQHAADMTIYLFSYIKTKHHVSEIAIAVKG